MPKKQHQHERDTTLPLQTATHRSKPAPRSATPPSQILDYMEQLTTQDRWTIFHAAAACWCMTILGNQNIGPTNWSMGSTSTSLSQLIRHTTAHSSFIFLTTITQKNLRDFIQELETYRTTGIKYPGYKITTLNDYRDLSSIFESSPQCVGIDAEIYGILSIIKIMDSLTPQDLAPDTALYYATQIFIVQFVNHISRLGGLTTEKSLYTAITSLIADERDSLGHRNSLSHSTDLAVDSSLWLQSYPRIKEKILKILAEYHHAALNKIGEILEKKNLSPSAGPSSEIQEKKLATPPHIYSAPPKRYVQGKKTRDKNKKHNPTEDELYDQYQREAEKLHADQQSAQKAMQRKEEDKALAETLFTQLADLANIPLLEQRDSPAFKTLLNTLESHRWIPHSLVWKRTDYDANTVLYCCGKKKYQYFRNHHLEQQKGGLDAVYPPEKTELFIEFMLLYNNLSAACLDPFMKILSKKDFNINVLTENNSGVPVPLWQAVVKKKIRTLLDSSDQENDHRSTAQALKVILEPYHERHLLNVSTIPEAGTDLIVMLGYFPSLFSKFIDFHLKNPRPVAVRFNWGFIDFHLKNPRPVAERFNWGNLFKRSLQVSLLQGMAMQLAADATIAEFYTHSSKSYAQNYISQQYRQSIGDYLARLAPEIAQEEISQALQYFKETPEISTDSKSPSSVDMDKKFLQECQKMVCFLEKRQQKNAERLHQHPTTEEKETSGPALKETAPPSPSPEADRLDRLDQGLSWCSPS